MLNGEFALSQAQHWAGRLLAEKSEGKSLDDRALIAAAYVQAYAREPQPAELDLCAKFIANQCGGHRAMAATAGERNASPMPSSDSRFRRHTPRRSSISATLC